MDRGRWTEIDALFEQAGALPPEGEVAPYIFTDVETLVRGFLTDVLRWRSR